MCCVIEAGDDCSVCALAVMAVARAEGGERRPPSVTAAPNLPATVAKSSPASSPRSDSQRHKGVLRFPGLAGSFCTMTAC